MQRSNWWLGRALAIALSTSTLGKRAAAETPNDPERIEASKSLAGSANGSQPNNNLHSSRPIGAKDGFAPRRYIVRPTLRRPHPIDGQAAAPHAPPATIVPEEPRIVTQATADQAPSTPAPEASASTETSSNNITAVTEDVAPLARWTGAAIDAREAFALLDTALETLEGGHLAAAQRALADAADSLRELYVGGPAALLGPLEQALSDARALRAAENMSREREGAIQAARDELETSAPRVQLTTVEALVSEHRSLLDPEVTERIQRAAAAALAGRTAELQEQLIGARQRLIEDLALAPVEDAYARVAAAEAELEAGNLEIALRLLRAVEPTFALVEVSVPLVPIRFDLRAAAAATDEGQLRHAEALVARARERLGTLVEATEPGLARQLQPLARELSRLEAQLASDRSSSASKLRALALALRRLERAPT